jgi:signal transduction histidine kinase
MGKKFGVRDNVSRVVDSKDMSREQRQLATHLDGENCALRTPTIAISYLDGALGASALSSSKLAAHFIEVLVLVIQRHAYGSRVQLRALRLDKSQI